MLPRDVTIGVSFLNSALIVSSISSTTLEFRCEIFRSSTCHSMVICLPLSILFATRVDHKSPFDKLASLDESFLQKSNAARKVPYNAFRSSTYKTVFLFSVQIYLWYVFDSSFTNNCAIVLLKQCIYGAWQYNWFNGHCRSTWVTLLCCWSLIMSNGTSTTFDPTTSLSF